MLLGEYTSKWIFVILPLLTNVSALPEELEYLAVYGRDSMAAFRQLSSHGQKIDPEYLYEPM